MNLPISNNQLWMAQFRKRGRPNNVKKETVTAPLPLVNNEVVEESCSYSSQIPISAQVVAVSPLDTSYLRLGEQQSTPSSIASQQLTTKLEHETLNLDMSQPARSWWRYFCKLKEENRAICLTCGQAFNRGAKQSTTSLSHHLKMHHRNLYIAVQMARDEQQKLGRNANKRENVANNIRCVPVLPLNVNGVKQSKEHLQMTAKHLIQAVRDFPELYSSDNGGTNSSPIENLDQIWSQVKQIVAPNSEDHVLPELKKRWFHLREKFKKELRIVLRDNFAYQPKWPHFKELTWLAAHLDEFRNISILLEEFVSNQNIQLTNDKKMENNDSTNKDNAQKLDDLYSPMDFEDVLSQGKASTSKQLPRKDQLFQLEEEELKNELNEQELREVASALGIDVGGVQNGQMKMELEYIDTSFLTDKNGCCPTKEAVQTIGFMLMKNSGCSSSKKNEENGCHDYGNDEINRAPSTSCGCICTKIESNDDHEIEKNEREFGLDIARRLMKLEKKSADIIKIKILRLFDREEKK